MDTELKRRGRKALPIRADQYILGRPVNRLRELRVKRGLTQKQLAAIIGVSPQTICIAERNGRGLGEDNWYRLADYFDVDPRFLKGYSRAA